MLKVPDSEIVSPKIIESPRDGIQGLKKFIPTKIKADYINSILKIGFDEVDIGSFVSEKAIPQLRDTAEVINLLDLDQTRSKLLVLVANKKGGEEAAEFDEINSLIFPFSVSPTFLKRNINSDFYNSIKTIDELRNVCEKRKKNLIVYITMGFGNPYGDIWNIDIIFERVEKLIDFGITTIPFSDILGNSTPSRIHEVFSSVIKEFPTIEFGFHLHTNPHDWHEKVGAALNSGCKRFDTVINGLGGCPMAGKELLGNLDTLSFLNFLDQKNISHKINNTALNDAVEKSKIYFT
jgi:hydroxymethylglutaryl-CoA lyase